jgi:transposase-like protein
MAKLTDAEVAEIRHLYFNGQGTQRSLAKQFGCCKSQIGYIVRNEVRTRPTEPRKK